MKVHFEFSFRSIGLGISSYFGRFGSGFVSLQIGPVSITVEF